MNPPQPHFVAFRITPAPAASELRLTAGVSAELLAETSQCNPCAGDWGLVHGEVSDLPDPGTTFLRVVDQPHLLAFKEEMMSRTDTQLELYLSLGEDLLPVKTPRGNYLIWHSLDCTNVLDRTRGWEDGRLVRPHFIAHRLGGAGGLFTNFGCCATHIFTMEFWENLPRALGGPLDNDHPPEGFEMRDCRSFIQEYFWQGWSGLQFEEVWNSHGG